MPPYQPLPSTQHRRSLKCAASLLTLSAVLAVSVAIAAPRTWFYMPTGNGHGFQVFDRSQGKITTFLEHPYRYVSPSGRGTPSDREVPGVGRRDLAYDIYFGAKVDGAAVGLK